MILSRLLTEKDRPALNKVLDQLEGQLVQAITENVTEGATPLFRRGYRLYEVQILGFGEEITVEPLKGLSRIHLWWRRVLLRCRLAEQPTFRQYGQIPCEERDTQRLIDGLKIFERARTLEQ